MCHKNNNLDKVMHNNKKFNKIKLKIKNNKQINLIKLFLLLNKFQFKKIKFKRVLKYKNLLEKPGKV